jgi:hypothetical protein
MRIDTNWWLLLENNLISKKLLILFINKKMKNVQNGGYSIDFNLIWTHDDIKKAFYLHLRKEKNTNPFDFLIDVDNLHNVKKNIESYIENIMNLYIKEGSVKELNLGYKQRMKVLESKKNDKTVFNEICEAVKVDMISDTFIRFLSSKYFKKIIQKYQNNSNVLIKNEKKTFIYDDESFKDIFISDEDMRNMQILFQSSYWDLSKNVSVSKFYWSNYIFLENVKLFEKALIFKTKTLLPYAMDRVVLGIIPLYEMMKYSKSLISTEEYETISFEDVEKKGNKYNRNSTHLCFNYNFGFLNQKISRLSVSITCNYKENCFYMMMKPKIDSETDDFNSLSKKSFDIKNEKTGKLINTKIYMVADYSGWKIEKMGENKTLLTKVHNMIGSGAKKFINEENDINKKLISHLEKDFSIESSIKKLNSDPIGKLVLNTKYFEKSEKKKVNIDFNDHSECILIE